jgi:hypothetical protein
MPITPREGCRVRRLVLSLVAARVLVDNCRRRRHTMRRVFIFLLTLLVVLAFTTVARASHPGENTNTVTFTLNCGEFGTFTGSLPGGAGGALLLEGDGVAVAQGLAELDGEFITEPTPGLEQQGKLVQCRFTFPGQRELVAFVLFAPANP